MEVFQGKEHASNEKLGLFFGESFVLGQVIPKIATRHQIDDEVQILTIIKSIVHVNKKWMVKLA